MVRAVSVCALIFRAADAAAQTVPAGVPDLCATPTISSARSGAWSDPLTWSPARVPGANDRVRIALGDTVTYDVVSDAAVTCVGVVGRLAFSTSANTRLTVATLVVYQEGALTIGTSGAPVPAGVTAELVIANRAPTATEQLDTGLLGFGTVDMSGAEKTPTWTRLATEPRAGDTTLTLAQPVSGWRVGDRLILPDTRHLHWNEVTGWARTTPQWEELTLSAISSDGRMLTLSSALRFNHLGARDGATGNGTLRFLPHVGNLTRNVIVRSQSPIAAGGTQGHVLFQNRADVDIRYVAFRDLGRTRAAATGAGNQIGRYPVHFHHVVGPTTTPANGYQFTFVGNAVDGGSTAHTKRWAVAIHDSHYGLVSDNVLYNYGGALLTTEDGSESYNVIERNFAMRGTGTGGRLGEGNEGQGFWFRGPNNYVRGNVAANFDSDETEASYGFKYFMRLLGTVRIPTAKGQDSTAYVAVDGNNMPILEFSDNEVYGVAQGLTYWWLSSQDPAAPPDPKESVFRNLQIWHVYNAAVYHYPSARVRFDGLTILGQDPATSACCGRGWHGEDYAATDIRLVNADIEGMITGIKWSAAGTGLQVIENSTLRNQTDTYLKTMYSANGPGWLPPRRVIANNVNFQGGTTIAMDWSVTGQSNTTQRDTILVYAYKGVASDNFQVFYNQQATQNVAGGLAPCGNHRPEINGIVCSTAASSGPAITWMNPFQGATSGGTLATIFGANFVSGATVSFGGTAGTNVVVSSSTINTTAPAHAAGNTNVVVTNPGGSNSTFTNGFRFVTAPGCSYTVSPTSQTIAVGGGTASTGVTTGSGCAWSATSQASWISITAGTSGTGTGSVTYSVAANPGTATRTGTLTVAGQTVTVTQQGQPCSFTVSPTSVSAAAAGGAQSASVTTTAGCGWTATSNATWITVTAGASASGSGTVSYTVAGNSSAAARTGTLTIAGQTVTVNQAGQTCSFTVSPTSVSPTAAGGAQSASVTAAAGCSWTAVSNAAWISVTAGSTGSGNGTVGYTVDANGSTASRTGTLTIANQTVTVTQAGQTCSFTVSPTSVSPTATGGAQSATVTAPAGCSWTSVSNAAWISVTAGSTGSGNGTVGYTVDANGTTASRTGTLTIANQTVTVTQQGQTSQPTCPCSIWSATATPANITGDSQPVELGVKLRSDVNGVITGVRFYKGATNTGTHVGHLWNMAGTLLASATFTNETASGWQQVTFASPVAITANTTYIASYHTDAGNYALNGGQFLSAGVDSPPLHALANGVDGPNAVFVYGASAFPTNTFNGNNYWVDVVFNTTPPDTTPPTVTSVAPANGATGVSTTATVTATFSEAMNASTITTGTFVLRNPSNAVVAATVSYNATTRVATLDPSQPLSGSTTYTATITGGSAGVNDAAGNPLANNVVWSFTTAAATPSSIWNTTTQPGAVDADTNAVELGVKFRADVGGTIVGLRFYKYAANTGTHIGSLWTSTGTLLGSATFVNETASGWQEVTFATPLAISANTTYIASYHTNVGRYAVNENYFTSPTINGNLRALQDGTDGPNGVYRYSAGSAFPDQTFMSSNYWVDVLFMPQ
ncbi:MAG TPA: DUF4082 domain-containing protein [Vicinamibacterales bacterium]|nr:DUF4082 domain-containing protein [Vicinamibacterales bacterium]